MHMALCINMSRHTHIVYDDEYREVIGEVHSGDTYCCEFSGIDLTGVVYFKSYSGEFISKSSLINHMSFVQIMRWMR